MNNLQIKHYTEGIPGIVRNEIYICDDMRYVERFDDLTGQRMFGEITMYNGIKVCGVNADGSISMRMPTDWVTSHDSMMRLVVDIERLDVFIAAVCNSYR